MISIYRQFQVQVQSETDSQLNWMRNDQIDTLAKLPQSNFLRDKHVAYLEIIEAEIAARQS